MNKVYQLTDNGWKRVFTAQSFGHACKVCKELRAKNPTHIYCVNS
jgi:hypothetical protein